jgi:hypothetical protein
MIKYYPQTRIKTNLYTRGNTYKFPNGTPYTGRYYLLYDGTAYTGANPVVGTNRELIPIDNLINSVYDISTQPSIPYIFATSTNNPTNANLNKALNNQSLEELVPYYPTPSESEYQIGYFNRYFAKNVTGPGYIIEISKSDYASIKNGAYKDTSILYESANLLWQLTGPLKDTRISQYQIQGGVFDTNKRVTEAKSFSFIGLVDYIGGDYTKFARITN